MSMKKKVFFTLALIYFEFSGLYAQSLRDAEGNVYAATTIGKQVWMAENLKTTKLNDGTPIPLVTKNSDWTALRKPGYCWFENNSENKEIYGALYNWYAVDSKKLCPTGWHVPTVSEWKILVALLGDVNTAGDKLKEKGNDHWQNSISIVTDEFNFTALPAGFRFYTGAFPNADNFAVWWSATGIDDSQAWNYGLFYTSSKIYNGADIKRAGFSVRCLKDN
jgi:uncharacterized protein (TIGR02145 family)